MSRADDTANHVRSSERRERSNGNVHKQGQINLCKVEMWHARAEGTLEDVLFLRIKSVLEKYRAQYPTAEVVYVKPYQLTADMVRHLASRLQIPPSFIPTGVHNTLNGILDAIVERITKIGDPNIRVLDPRWRTKDVVLSAFHIPEPTTSGAERLADKIRALNEL